MNVTDGMITFVITTIHPPTKSLQRLVSLLENAISETGTTGTIGEASSTLRRVVVIGDKKTPKNWELSGTKFVSVDEQVNSQFALGKFLPINSYTRKMLGYLDAVKSGSEWIRETDDDNTPFPEFLGCAATVCEARTYSNTKLRWLNPYLAFSSRRIWPRGLPLSHVNPLSQELEPFSPSTVSINNVAIYQALANGEPDVDAIYRLTVDEETNFEFRNDAPLLIPKSIYAPFNSQATTWHYKVFPLMYLPVTCTFRMTDIWRSFIVQRILRDTDFKLIFEGPRVHQDRNQHNLMKDFEEEVPGYLGNEKICHLLDGVRLLGGENNFLKDLVSIYSKLIEESFLLQEEMVHLNNWIADLFRAGWK